MNHTIEFTNSATYKCLGDMQEGSLELCLTYCGWESCRPGHRFGPNQRTSSVLHVIQKGKGTLEINKKVYELKAGDAFFLPPGVEAWYEADWEEPWCYMWVGFIGINAEEYASSAGFSLKNPVRKVNCVENVWAYISQMLEAHQLTYANELRRNAFLRLVLAELIGDYQQTARRANTVHHYSGALYAKHAMEYITYHYNERLKINELADYIGVNRSYLASSFKKTFGCSPQEFLVNLRMEKAKVLLKKQDMSISAVANAVGYTDQLAFSKVFKQHFGMSPSTYKDEKNCLVVKTKKEEHKNF